MMSTAATWVQVLVMMAAAAPVLAAQLAPAALAGAAVAAASAVWHARAATLAPTAPDSPGAKTGPSRPGPAAGHPTGPLRVGAALLVAVMLVAVALLVQAAQAWLGDTGVMAAAALGALADAHAAVASLGTLQAAGRITEGWALAGVLVAVAVNSLMRVVTAALSGGMAYARRMALSLLASGSAAGAVLGLMHSRLA